MNTKQTIATPRWNENRGYWQINVQKDRVRKSFYSSAKGRAGKAECLQKANKWLMSSADGDPIVKDAFDEYREYKAKTASSGRLSQVDSFMRRICKPPLSMRRLSRVTPADWQSILDTAKDDGLSRSTITNLRSVISEFIDYAVSRRWSLNRLETRLKVSSNKEKKEKEILQPDSIRKLFSISTTTHKKPDWYIHLYRLAVVTGMRRGEVCGLQWSDITDETITISRAINNAGEITNAKNSNARRTFAITDHARTIIAAQREQLRKAGIVSMWVFPTSTGGFPSPAIVSRHWETYCDIHDIGHHVTFYSLRHTMISLCKDSVPLELLKQVVGHSDSMNTFGTYGHVVNGDQAKAARAIDAAMKTIIDTQKCGEK